MRKTSGRMVSSGVHSGTSAAAKRGSSTTTLQPSVSETLGSAVKLGQVGRDKERKEKEDVELKPPWELLPYCRDSFVGNSYTVFDSLIVLGYPDFYPSTGAEEEYKLTEKAITDGFENKPIVSVPPKSRPLLIKE